MASTRPPAKGNSQLGAKDLCYIEMMDGIKFPMPCDKVDPDKRRLLADADNASGTNLIAKVAIPTILAGGVAYGVSDNPVVSLGAAAVAGVASYFFLRS